LRNTNLIQIIPRPTKIRSATARASDSFSQTGIRTGSESNREASISARGIPGDIDHSIRIRNCAIPWHKNLPNTQAFNWLRAYFSQWRTELGTAQIGVH
jgi:hypothetical protein